MLPTYRISAHLPVLPLGREIARTTDDMAGSPRTTVYALVDSRDPSIVRYIGSSLDPVARLHSHFSTPTAAPYAWMRSVVADGGHVAMLEIAVVPDRETAYSIEEAQIAHHRALGHADLNRTTLCGSRSRQTRQTA